MSDYDKGLFSSWVPKPIQLLLILIFTLVNLSLNSIYTGNISMMTGSLGSMPEYLIFANYAGTIGMAAGLPMALRVKMRFRVKEILLVAYSVIAILSWGIATTDSVEFIVGASFIMGFVKIFAMMEFILPLIFLLGNDNRGNFYAVFYPVAIGVGNISGYFATKLALYTNWQFVHITAVAICLLMLMLTAIFVHSKRFSRKLPFTQIDWISVLLFSSSFMFLSYFLSFGKIYNWFQTKEIIYSFWAAIISFILLAFRQLSVKRPYLSFAIFKKSNVQNGMVLLLFTGMFVSTSSLQSIYTSGVLGYDVLTNASLNLMMIPGIALAGYIAARWFKIGLNLKMFIFLGFAVFTMFTVMMYFMMVPELNYEMWWLPMILKGFGMCALFIAVWYYTLDKLEMEQMLQAIGLVLVFRTVVSIAIFSSFFSWLQYQFQWQSVNNLAVYLDGNLLSLQNALGNMKSLLINAVLSSNKKLFGLISIAGIGIMLFVMQHHFNQIRFTRLRWSRKRIYHAITKRNLNIDRKRFKRRRNHP